MEGKTLATAEVTWPLLLRATIVDVISKPKLAMAQAKVKIVKSRHRINKKVSQRGLVVAVTSAASTP